MGLERLVEEQDADYIGKAALERIRVEGVDRKLVGIEVRRRRRSRSRSRASGTPRTTAARSAR